MAYIVPGCYLWWAVFSLYRKLKIEAGDDESTLECVLLDKTIMEVDDAGNKLCDEDLYTANIQQVVLTGRMEFEPKPA